MTAYNWYRTGSVSVTNGSTAVTGVGTYWSTQVNPGDAFMVDDTYLYEVLTVNSDTSLTIQSVGGSGGYQGSTASNISYGIARNWNNANITSNLAASVSSLLASYQANSNALNGKFGDGAVATPGIAFLNEAGTGWFRPSAGVAALAIQGAEALRMVGTASGVPAMLGLGTTAPAHALDIATSSNALFGARVTNSSTGTAARTTLTAANAANSVNLGINGANYAGNGVLAAGRGFAEAATGMDFAAGVTSGNAFTWGTGSGYTQKMALDATGHLGIGVSPAAWGSGYCAVEIGGATLSNSGRYSQLTHNAYFNGANWIYKASSVPAVLVGLDNAAGSFAIDLAPAGTVGGSISFTQAFGIDANLNVFVGTSSAALSAHSFNKAGLTQNAGAAAFSVSGNGVLSAVFCATTGTGWSSAGATAAIGKDGTTSRSFNLAGTVNTNGADYAEYRPLIPALYGVVPKGALLGYNAQGLMTNVMADVVGRVLPKSTSPSYVGNDGWGTEAAITAAYGVASPGEPPQPTVGEDGTLTPVDPTAEAAYQARLTAFNAAMQTERAKWDRIALCGVVPVNVTGLGAGDVGKYLIPTAAADGTITAIAVARADLTLGQYIDCFGTVEMIGADGRPMVNVKCA